jgi:predicted alpha/beta superfamily hydrolase
VPTRKWLLVVVAAAAISAATGYIVRDTSDSDPDTDGATLSRIHSTILNEEREYAIYLPEGYDPGGMQTYPVLYVLDGQSQSAPAAETAAMLGRIGVIPQMIVVGVHADGTTRNQDYTPPGMRMDTDDPASPHGSGDRFLEFLEQELITTIEKEYRTARPRMLAGWSRSGLFVVYSQIANPALFDARFAQSPALWRDDNAILIRLRETLATKPTLPGFLFLSLGDKENDKMTGSFQQAVDLLQKQAPSTLRWQAYRSRGGVHETNPLLSLPVGLFAFLRPVSTD